MTCICGMRCGWRGRRRRPSGTARSRRPRTSGAWCAASSRSSAWPSPRASPQPSPTFSPGPPTSSPRSSTLSARRRAARCGTTPRASSPPPSARASQRTRRRRAEGQPPSLEDELELHRHAMRTRRFRRNKIISEVRFCPRARAPARSCAAEQGRFGGAAQADQVTSEEVRAEELLERAAHMRDATEALQRLTLPSTTWLASLPEPPPLSPLSPASPLRNGPCLPRAARRRRRRRPPPLPAARLKRGRACRSSGAGHTARDAGGGVPGPGLVARWPRRGGGRRRAQVARA